MCLCGHLRVCICSVIEPDAHRGQKKASDLFELSLQMIVSCHMGAGYEPRSFLKAAVSAINCLVLLLI